LEYERKYLLGVIFKEKHICPIRTTMKKYSVITPPSNAAKPIYYNKKRSTIQTTTTKPKTDNSFEFLIGTPESVKKQYEYLSDLVRDSGGKVHGSQSHIIDANSNMYLIVYYEVPAGEGQREEVKQKCDNYRVIKWLFKDIIQKISKDITTIIIIKFLISRKVKKIWTINFISFYFTFLVLIDLLWCNRG